MPKSRKTRRFSRILACKQHENACRPLRETALIVLFGFFLFMIGGIFAVLFPNKRILVASLIWTSLLFLSLSAYACWQYYRHSQSFEEVLIGSGY